MTQRSKYRLAALASAAMPGIVVSGVRDAGQPSPTDEANGIDQAVVQDAAGKLYDVYVSDTEAGRKRLADRVRAADTLTTAREPGGLGFSLDRVLAFADGTKPKAVTGDSSVMVAVHHAGSPRPLDLLTMDDCSAIGTAIGAIHRLRPTFLAEAGYHAFSTGQIRAQLTAWIKRLRQAGHIPPEITDSWAQVLETDGLWSFSTCFVHGGFSDGDVLFSGSTITAITNWQDMQVNDPARDLAWIFAKLDESHRNAVLSAYGRMLGSRLDDLIMLRANLWLQMEQVGEFIQALGRADNARIMQFKAQVERLAHQLSVARAASRPAAAQDARRKPPSTITVGTLLHESERRRAQADTLADAADDANDADRTGSSDVKAAGTADADSTADRRPVTATGSTRPQSASHASSETMAMPGSPADASDDGDDDTADHDVTPAGGIRVDGEMATVVIPLIEREERARRDAAETGSHARQTGESLPKA